MKKPTLATAGVGFFMTISIIQSKVFSSEKQPVMSPIDADTQINAWFQEGAVRCEMDDLQDQKTACPYDQETVARRWWSRGYAYTARLFRAIAAESKLPKAICVRLQNDAVSLTVQYNSGFCCDIGNEPLNADFKHCWHLQPIDSMNNLDFEHPKDPTTNDYLCTPEHPMPADAPELSHWKHTNAEEVGDQEDGHPAGDTVTKRCKECGHTWKEDLPQ